MDTSTADAFLQGSWKGRAETWLFESGVWTQFNGGTHVETTYAIEALPENLFTVVSGETGSRYVVHTNALPPSMSWYREGETEQIGFYTRPPQPKP